MEKMTLGADEIYTGVIKHLIEDSPLFYYYTVPWEEKVIFHGSPQFIRHFMRGRLKEVVLLLVDNDLYKIIDYSVYKTKLTTLYKRKRDKYDC